MDTICRQLAAAGVPVEGVVMARSEIGSRFECQRYLQEQDARIDMPGEFGASFTYTVGGLKCHALEVPESSDWSVVGEAFRAIVRRHQEAFRPKVLFTFGSSELAVQIREDAAKAGLAVVFALHNLAYKDNRVFRDCHAIRLSRGMLSAASRVAL